ncbi:MAG: DEAD/DEAH box helicase [Bryobacteraceae bacterium]
MSVRDTEDKTIKLRPYQEQALKCVRAKLRAGCNRQIVKWPTGLGKTVLFSTLPDALHIRGRMLVIVHREELASQAADKLRRWNPSRSIGLEMANSRCNGEQLVVASVQSIGRKGSSRLQQFKPCDFEAIIIDEAHHATATTCRNIVEHFQVVANKHRLLLGVTATPNRADGTGLGEVFEEIVHEVSMLQAITDGWLVDIKGIRVRTGETLNGVHNLGGDFNLSELGSNVNTPQRNDLVARAWLNQAEGRQTVIFAVDVQHALNITKAFQAYGVVAEAVWGDDPLRREKLAAHRTKKTRVVVNCQILTEGYDDWQVSCIGMARPTQSEGLYTQMIGRGTRIPDRISNLVEARAAGVKSEKESLIVLDFVDGTSKHSLVTLPSLFGLSSAMDLKGKSMLAVMDEVEAIKKRKPTFDITTLTDAEKLKAYAEEVDLFKVTFSTEIAEISGLSWHKTSPTCYVLALLNKESVAILTDILEKWHIIGDCNGTHIRESRYTFAEAIRYADQRVRELGGVSLLSLLSRKALWHDGPPTESQRRACARMGIQIPITATKGDVSKKITEAIAVEKKKRSLGTDFEALEAEQATKTEEHT